MFLARRTADPQTALDLWAETFAQAVAGQRRYRDRSEGEAAAWLYTIARRQLALYYRRGKAEQRAADKLKLEREPASPELLAEIERRAGLTQLRVGTGTIATAAVAATLLVGGGPAPAPVDALAAVRAAMTVRDDQMLVVRVSYSAPCPTTAFATATSSSATRSCR